MLIGPALIVFIATFLLASVAVMIASLVLQRQQEAQGPTEEAPGILKIDVLSSISLWHTLLHRFDFVEGMRIGILQAGLDWSVGRVTAMMLLIGAFTLAVLTSFNWIPGSMALAIAGLAASTPYLYILRLRKKRFAQFEEQFSDALDFLSRALRAGHPFPVSLELLSQENTPPLASEMRMTADERRLGMPLNQALDNLTTRVPLLSVRIFTAAVKLQSRTGGKLSEALGQLAETMREHFSLQGEVRSIAAHGRMTGMVLTVMPIFIAIMMTIVNPGYLAVLFYHPLGKHLIAAAIVCLVLAHIVIRRIVDIRL